MATTKFSYSTTVSGMTYLDITDPDMDSIVNNAVGAISVLLNGYANELLRENPQVSDSERTRFLVAAKNTIYRDAEWS